MLSRTTILCGAAILLASTCSTLALTGTPPVLVSALHSGEQFQFTLRGQTNVIYVIESSSDLRTWTPALTNSDPHATRTITVPAGPTAAFWRIRRPPAPLFSHAIAARETVYLAGSGVIDSFDSGDTNYSTFGQYDAAKRKAGGHIAAGLATSGAVSIGNTEVAGVVSTEPRGTVTVGSTGGVGSFAWLSLNRGTIEPGHHRDDMNFAFAPATLPSNFNVPVAQLLLPGTRSINGTNYKYAILVDGDYKTPSISLRNGEKMLINARARLYVAGYTEVTGPTNHILLGPQASIEWYAGGSVNLAGGGCINASGSPQNFSIFGFSSAPITYTASTRLIGTIYAPFAPVTLNGTTDVMGAIVCDNLTLYGTLGIHFDENLARVGPWR